MFTGETAEDSTKFGGKAITNFLGNGTGYICPAQNGGDMNTYRSEYHGFVFNMTNGPATYGFLDVTWFNGTGFAPSVSGVCRQIFTSYDNGRVYTRVWRNNAWSVWINLSVDSTARLAVSGGTISGNLGISGTLSVNVIQAYTSANYVVRIQNLMVYANSTNLIILYPYGYGSTTYGLQLVAYAGSPGSLFIHCRKDNYAVLGSSSERWKEIFCVSSAISTSDRREKYDISYIGEDSEYDTKMTDEQLVAFILGLRPVVFKRKNGESGRPHHGVISQDVEELLEELDMDHAGFIRGQIYEEVEEFTPEGKKVVKQVEVPGKYSYGMRYEELVTDNIRFSQLLWKENQELKKKNKQLEETIQSVLSRLSNLENTLNS